MIPDGTNVKFKVGDRVKIIGPSNIEYLDPVWHMGEIGTIIINDIGSDYPLLIEFVDSTGWWPISSVHKHTSKRASITIEKLVSGGVKCVRILKFNNVKTIRELSPEYVSAVGSFYYFEVENHRRGSTHGVVDGIPKWVLDDNKSNKKIGCIMDRFSYGKELKLGVPYLCMEEGAVFTEETFNLILEHMKKAGELLADINEKAKQAKKEQKLRESWHGIEEVEI